MATSVAGSQSHDTAGSSIDHFSIYLCRRHRCRTVHPAPRPSALLLRVYRLYQSVKLASALQDKGRFMISSLSYLFSGFISVLPYGTYILLLLLCRQGVSARRRRSLCCLMAPPRRVLLRLVFIVPESSYVALAEKQVVRCTCALSGSSFSNVFTYINVEKNISKIGFSCAQISQKLRARQKNRHIT